MSRRVILTLVALAALIAVARLHTYHEPLERDITGAAVIGHELLAGRALYADMWDHKPPALHATHAAAILMAGHWPPAPPLLNDVPPLPPPPRAYPPPPLARRPVPRALG